MLIGALAAVSVAVAALACWFWGGFQGLGWLWMLPLTFVCCFVLLAVLAFLFLWLMLSFVKMDKERTADSPFYRRLVEVYSQAILTILGMRVKLTGKEKLPKEGRFMLVCNHLNDLDPVTLLSVFRGKQLAFITKWENLKLFLAGPAMHMLLCQPINRENDREALKTILKCIHILQEDKASIGVFPEGYTSRDHRFHQFRPGVFKIAQKAKVPIVVCTITNTYKVFHNIVRLKPTRIDLHVLEVIMPEDFAKLSTVELGERIHKLMADDLGEAYAPDPVNGIPNPGEQLDT